MSNKKNVSGFTQASLLAREEKVLQDAEIVITTQRTRIGELRSELERLNAEKLYWSNTHMKEMSDVIQENTKLRLQLDEMQADLNALRHTQDSTDNLISNLTEALGIAESQLLAQENELKNLRSLTGNLPTENNNLREENQRLIAENEKLKRTQEEGKHSVDNHRVSKLSDSNAIQAVNISLNKHTKLARDLDFRTEELKVNKMCLLQLESDLLEHQLLVEQQRVEIQRLNTAVEALNREKALIPPVVITNRQFDSFSDENLIHKMSPKEFAEQIISEINKSIPKINNSIMGKSEYFNSNENNLNETPDDIDIVQYRTMEEQRMLISRLLKGLDQLGFTRSDATCYKEKASDYRWFYSAVISHSVTYTSTRDFQGNEKNNENISPPGFFNLFVRVESGNISIFQNIDEEVPLFSIKPWKCNVEIYEKHKQFVLTRTSTTSEQIENHILYCQTEDEFNRWFYALSYGGFIQCKELLNNNMDADYKYKNNNGNYVICIKIFDSSNNSKFETAHLSIYNNNLTFSNGKPAIKTSNSKLNINIRKQQIMIEEILNERLNVIVFAPDDPRDFDELKSVLSKNKWIEIKVGTDSQNIKVKRDNEDIKINNSGKELVPQSINFSVNNSVNTNNNVSSNANANNIRHGIILVQNEEVLLYHDESDETPFTTINTEDCTIECDRRKMSILLLKIKNKQFESFYYMFASLEEFNRSWARLREGGIKEIKPENKPKFKQICVVCKNKMYFYKDYNDSNISIPLLTISPDDTNCHINSERNEIILLHTQSDGTRKKIALDCANMDEFTRWNIALYFGGFIQGLTKSSMSKYTFDISLFGVVKNNGIEQLRNIDTKENKPIYKDFYNITDYQSIEIFRNQESKEKNRPLIVIPFKDTEYIGDAKKRQIIFLTRRGKAGEVRIIINLQTLNNFDIMNKDLINVDFPLLETNSATSLKAEYIIGAKNGVICVYSTSRNRAKLSIKAINESRYSNKGTNHNNNESNLHKFPECGYIKYSTSDFICVASRAGRSVALRRKEDDYDALSVRCKSLTEYEKWERSMSIAGFINNDSSSNGYLPPITYLFHSLDYDFRKQPILPNLEVEKNANSAAVTHSDIQGSDYSLSQEDAALNTQNNHQNKKHLKIPENKKLLDNTTLHKQTPPSRIILSRNRNRVKFKLENIENGLDTDAWDEVSEIEYFSENKNSIDYTDSENNGISDDIESQRTDYFDEYINIVSDNNSTDDSKYISEHEIEQININFNNEKIEENIIFDEDESSIVSENKEYIIPSCDKKKKSFNQTNSVDILNNSNLPVFNKGKNRNEFEELIKDKIENESYENNEDHKKEYKNKDNYNNILDYENNKCYEDDYDYEGEHHKNDDSSSLVYTNNSIDWKEVHDENLEGYSNQAELNHMEKKYKQDKVSWKKHKIKSIIEKIRNKNKISH